LIPPALSSLSWLPAASRIPAADAVWPGECDFAAIPYFRNSLAGDFGYTVIRFGGLPVLENRVAWMRESVAKATASA
jgi:hypothetical protein